MSAIDRLTIANALAELDGYQRLRLLGALRLGVGLHEQAGRPAVAAWHATLIRLLEHVGRLQRAGEPPVALDAVGLLTEAAGALAPPEIEALAVGLILALEEVPGTPQGDLLYNLVLLLDEEKSRRVLPASNDGSRPPL